VSNDHQRQDREVSHAHLGVIDQALAGLPPRTRTAFSLYRSKRLTRNEIAIRLGVSPSLVSAMIGEALQVLKRCRNSFDAG
jgi:RNA polymerase sigma-70 factor (ECF subfamily)